MSRTLAAEEFKEQCLEILDHVGPEGVVITKHGRPVAKLVPIEGTCGSPPLRRTSQPPPAP